MSPEQMRTANMQTTSMPQYARELSNQLYGNMPAQQGPGVNPFGANTPGGQNYQQQMGAQNPTPAFGGAPNLYRQYQGLARGGSPERDAMIRQMQGTDNGGQFNANMRAAGYQLGRDNEGLPNFTQQPGPVAPPAGGSTELVQRLQHEQGLNGAGQPLTPDWRSKMY